MYVPGDLYGLLVYEHKYLTFFFFLAVRIVRRATPYVDAGPLRLLLCPCYCLHPSYILIALCLFRGESGPISGWWKGKSEETLRSESSDLQEYRKVDTPARLLLLLLWSELHQYVPSFCWHSGAVRERGQMTGWMRSSTFEKQQGTERQRDTRRERRKR